jgi:hypothetical protein
VGSSSPAITGARRDGALERRVGDRGGQQEQVFATHEADEATTFPDARPTA